MWVRVVITVAKERTGESPKELQELPNFPPVTNLQPQVISLLLNLQPQVISVLATPLQAWCSLRKPYHIRKCTLLLHHAFQWCLYCDIGDVGGVISTTNQCCSQYFLVVLSLYEAFQVHYSQWCWIPKLGICESPGVICVLRSLVSLVLKCFLCLKPSKCTTPEWPCIPKLDHQDWYVCLGALRPWVALYP